MRRLVFSPIAAVLVGVLAACGSDSHSSSAADDHGHGDDGGGCESAASASAPSNEIAATLGDFKIELDPATVGSGPVVLNGTNAGEHPHEVVVVKGVAASALPTTADGVVDEDQLPDGAVIGELEAFDPGESCSATFSLTAGDYTLFCNITGEEGAHVELGMVTSLTVS